MGIVSLKRTMLDLCLQDPDLADVWKIIRPSKHRESGEDAYGGQIDAYSDGGRSEVY
ncbi:MAG: hypothetical protein SCM88_08805 [Bacillota bacterium]|nr:hypothetical protein [Bacillota bacterium]